MIGGLYVVAILSLQANQYDLSQGVGSFVDDNYMVCSVCATAIVVRGRVIAAMVVLHHRPLCNRLSREVRLWLVFIVCAFFTHDYKHTFLPVSSFLLGTTMDWKFLHEVIFSDKTVIVLIS